jgi:ribonuclease P protein component
MHLDVRFIASPLGVPNVTIPGVSRIGVVVPRHQRSAVDRNRLKRRLRELVRLELLPALRGGAPVDVAIRARREAYGASLDALRADVLSIGSGLTK